MSPPVASAGSPVAGTAAVRRTSPASRDLRAPDLANRRACWRRGPAAAKSACTRPEFLGNGPHCKVTMPGLANEP